MNKKLIGAIAGALIAGSSFSALAQPNLSLSSDSGQPGQTVTTEVSFENDSSVANLDFIFTYDPAVLTNPDLSECGGARPGLTSFNCSNPNPGEIRGIGVSAFPPESIPDQVISTISFEIVGGATTNTTTPLEFTAVNFTDAAGDAVAADQINDGTISITDGPQASLNVAGNGNFGSVEVGNSQNREFTVTNDGDPGTTLELTSAPAIDPAGGEFEITGGTCANGTQLTTNSCTIVVTYEPAASGPSTASPGLVVESDAGNESIELTGQGTAAQPQFSVTSTNLVLQASSEGETVSGAFTATNNGPSASSIVISNCTVDSDPSSSVSIDPTGATLAGGEAQQFTVTATSPAVGASYQAQIQCDVEEFDTDGNSIGTSTLDATASVSTRPAVIPTLSNVGMVLFAMLIGLVGLVVVRQRA